MKRIIRIICTLLIFALSMTSVFASHQSYNYMKLESELGKLGVLKTRVFKDDEDVTRYEALKTIILAIGGSDELVMEYNTNDLVFQPYMLWVIPRECGYYDMYEPLDGGEFEVKQKYATAESMGQINIAFYNGITKGEIHNGKRYFLFDKKVSIREAVTFMVRCLKGVDIEPDEAYKIAIEIGLIQKDDIYFGHGEQWLDYNYFRELLGRFIEQPRYLYFGNNEDFPNVSIDESGEMTYKEYLKTIE